MRRSSTSWHRRSAELGLFAALALGCVTRGAHERVVEERDALQERVRLLEASNESLSNERVKLIGEIDDLGKERESLSASVEELRSTRDQLQENLKLTESQLAERTAEVHQLRNTYDGLVSDLQSEVAGPVAVLLASLPPDAVHDIRTALEPAVEPFRSNGGLAMPSLAVVVSAR